MKTRRRACALLVSASRRLFLFKFECAMLQHGRTLWVTPGGGLEPGETFELAMRRELREELGLDIADVGEHAFIRRMVFTDKSGQEFLSDERYYVIRTADEKVVFDNMTANERRMIKAGRWWAADELRVSWEDFFSDNLAAILEKILANDLPPVPLEI